MGGAILVKTEFANLLLIVHVPDACLVGYTGTNQEYVIDDLDLVNDSSLAWDQL